MENKEIIAKISKIIEKNSISCDFIEEILIKDEKNLVIIINIAFLKLSKEELKKISEIIKKNIKNELNFDKITMIFEENKQKIVKKQEKITIFAKITEFVKNKFYAKNKPIEVKKVENKGEKIENEAKIAQNIEKKLTNVKNIIAVASAKGGVGKSSFALNLATSLAKIGHKIAIVDADIYGPSMPHLLDLKQKPEVKNQQFIPLKKYNMKIMSIGFVIDEGSAGVWRGPMITKILNQLMRSVNWASDGDIVDYMIIDMPPGTGDVYLSLAEKFAIDGVVLISTPQSLAVADVVRSVDCFKKLKIPIIGLVQNMAYLLQNGEKKYIFGRDNAKKMAQENNIKFLGDIEISQEISDSIEEKIPFIIKNPSSQIALQYGKMAEEIIDLLNKNFITPTR